MEWMSRIKPSTDREYMNEMFPAGKYFLSVQASQYHYSSPRVDGLPIDKYSAFEITIFDENKEWFNVKEGLPDLPPAVWNSFEDGSVPVAGWISPDDVQRVVDYLEAKN